MPQPLLKAWVWVFTADRPDYKLNLVAGGSAGGLASTCSRRTLGAAISRDVLVGEAMPEAVDLPFGVERLVCPELAHSTNWAQQALCLNTGCAFADTRAAIAFAAAFPDGVAADDGLAAETLATTRIVELPIGAEGHVLVARAGGVAAVCLGGAAAEAHRHERGEALRLGR